MPISLEQTLNSVLQSCNSTTPVLNGYGMSEVGSMACCQTLDCAEIGSVGIPLIKNIIAAFDPDTLHEMRYNEDGEICIQSPSMMQSYLDNPEETSETLRLHSDGKVWVHTGDWGCINKNGSVYVKGRLKRAYITQQSGTISKIFPERIESIILYNQCVAECSVVCVASKESTYLPIAHIVLKNEHCNNSEDSVRQQLIESCRTELPGYAQPTSYSFHNSLPLTPVGKVDYRALERMDFDKRSVDQA